MANYLTNTTDLTAVADAIREKTGESGSLIYPSGFVSAIEGISGSSTTHLTINNTDASINIGYYTGEGGVSQMSFEPDMETGQVTAEIDAITNSMLFLHMMTATDHSGTYLTRIYHGSVLSGNRYQYMDIYQVI